MQPNVLIIEDHELVVEVLKLVLKRKGYHSQTVMDGNAAWKLLQETRFPVVITDIVLPGLNGIEIIRRLRDIAPETRIIAISGKGRQVLDEALEAGAHATIEKPFKVDDIVNAIGPAIEPIEVSKS